MGKLAVLGPKHTFHDIARRKYIPHLVHSYFETFEEMFTALEKGDVTQALVAVSNNNAGLVGDNLERIEREFKIIEKFELPIKLFIGSRFPNSLESIKKIFSHPMAIKQTQKYFRKYSHIKFIATSSTAAAIDEVSKSNDKNAAVISSKSALEASSLLTIFENVEDKVDNATTFCLIEARR